MPLFSRIIPVYLLPIFCVGRSYDQSCQPAYSFKIVMGGDYTVHISELQDLQDSILPSFTALSLSVTTENIRKPEVEFQVSNFGGVK